MFERLNRFTPSTGGLDRDAILYAAGRQSARSWKWPLLCGVLVLSNVLTVAMLWPHPRNDEPVAPAPVQAVPEPGLPPASPPRDVWTAGSPPDVLQQEPTYSTGEFIQPGPTLTVGSALRID
jgi:hypothetical protein